MRHERSHRIVRSENQTSGTAPAGEIRHSATFTQARAGTLQLARRYQLSVYDASYLELALRRGLPLATLDEGLQKAAKKAGVKKFR